MPENRGRSDVADEYERHDGERRYMDERYEGEGPEEEVELVEAQAVCPRCDADLPLEQRLEGVADARPAPMRRPGRIGSAA